MYKRNFNKEDFETHKLEITLVHNSGKWDYKSMAKVSMWDSTAKKNTPLMSLISGFKHHILEK